MKFLPSFLTANCKSLFCLSVFCFINISIYAQRYQSEDKGRDELVVTYDIKSSFSKAGLSGLGIKLQKTALSIDKITYLGKVYSAKDFPSNIIQSLMTSPTTEGVRLNFDLYGGGRFLTKWSGASNSFSMPWTKVFSYQPIAGDFKANDEAKQKLRKEGETLVDNGGFSIKITSVERVFFNTMLIDNYLRDKKGTTKSN